LPKKLEAIKKNEAVRLSDLRIGAEALVLQIADPQLKLALLRIGLLEGDKVVLTEQAPLGGPMAFRVRGGKIAMRRSDAARVQIKLLA
jgi:Fe2+ transport system protein FeoA